MAKQTQRISVINMGFAAARSITGSYNENNEAYLRDMVRKHVPDAETVLACADRKYLLYISRTIKGVAKRVNDYDKKLLADNTDILDKIKSLPQFVDGVARELLDERICLQFEGRNIPFGCALSNAYAGTKRILR